MLFAAGQGSVWEKNLFQRGVCDGKEVIYIRVGDGGTPG